MSDKSRTSLFGRRPLARLLLPVLSFFLLPMFSQGQTTIVEWDFNTQQPTPSTSNPANASQTIGNGGGVGTIMFTSINGPNGT